MINRSSNIEKGRIISRRLFILISAKIALLVGITSRLYNLQISDKEKIISSLEKLLKQIKN